MKSEWSIWLSFPDPNNRGMLRAPFGPGCYELRRRSGHLVLFGRGGHVAARMSSLLVKGSGTRNNRDKRAFVEKHLSEIEYRTMACGTDKETREVERSLRAQASDYIFSERRVVAKDKGEPPLRRAISSIGHAHGRRRRTRISSGGDK
jgi:hypothetical protein